MTIKRVFHGIKTRIEKFYFLSIRHNTVAYAKHLGVSMGDGCQILTDPSLAFGSEPYLIKLGNHVDITYGVQFLTHEGGMWCARGMDSYYSKYDCFAPIKVGDNVMIGIHSIIMPGVTIGNNVIIAANCVVTKDVPDGAVIAGVPGKQISTVDKFVDSLKTKELHETKKLTPEGKKKYLLKVHPEWIND